MEISLKGEETREVAAWVAELATSNEQRVKARSKGASSRPSTEKLSRLAFVVLMRSPSFHPRRPAALFLSLALGEHYTLCEA